MTIIEFFDKDAIENVVSTLLCDPDRVVFIGNNYKRMNRAKARYQQVAEKYGRKAEFVVRGLERNDLWKIVETLEDVVNKYGDCTVDLSGGEELYLVAAGIVFQRLPGKLQLHRFNRNNETFYDCDADGCILHQQKLALSVEDNITLYGGRIIYEDDVFPGTRKWDLNPEFRNDVDVMWRLCTEHTKVWNALLTKASNKGKEDPLQVHIDIVRYCMQEGTGEATIPPLFEELEKEGLIRHLRVDNYDLHFRCKDEQVLRCLTTAGLVLELKTTILLDDTGLYNSIMTGVRLDWDGRNAENNVENEIDVLAMRGLIPVFVSCKNGTEVDVDELYKLGTVAEHFGGKNARKVLVASYQLNEDFNRRAHEMQIRVIDGVRTLSEVAFRNALYNITGELNR